MPTLALVTAHKSSLIYINLKIRGTDYAFIVDTGAECSLLSLDLATNLNLLSVSHITEMHGITGSVKTAVYKVPFRILGKRLNQLAVVDFSALCRGVGLRIGGLLAQDLFRQFDSIEFNNLKRQVSFHG